MKEFSIPLKAGLLAGFLLIAYTVILYALDVNIFNFVFSIINGLIVYGVMIAAAAIGLSKMRDQDLSGKITYLQALIGGFISLLVALYLSALFGYFLYGIFDPDYMVNKMDAFLYSLERMGLDEASIEQVIERMEKQINPDYSLRQSLWLSPVISLVLGAIIALFIKKDKTAYI